MSLLLLTSNYDNVQLEAVKSIDLATQEYTALNVWFCSKAKY